MIKRPLSKYDRRQAGKSPAPWSKTRRYLLLFAVLLIIGGIAGAWVVGHTGGGPGTGGGAATEESGTDAAGGASTGSSDVAENSGGAGGIGASSSQDSYPQPLDRKVDQPRLSAGSLAAFSLSDIPAYSGEPSVTVNDGRPYFEVDITQDKSETISEWFRRFFTGETSSDDEFIYEYYGPLDKLGRCTGAEACLGEAAMPTEPRGSIQNVRPSGWHTVKYAGIEGNYLYNRCHLIAYALAAENDNDKNLITGTRVLNTEGMEPYELEVMNYLYRTNNHVLYRVTPVFEGNELVARGVLMEAYSLEDNGRGICFCVYCYNEQPGVTIDHATGESSGPAFKGA